MILAAQYYRPPFPERRYWKEDLDGMKDAGLNAVQLWVLWSWVEPEPGRFDFSDYDELVEEAGKRGLGVVLSSIAELHPFWIHREIPDAHMIDHMGRAVISSNRGEAHQGLTPGGCTDNPEVLRRMGVVPGGGRQPLRQCAQPGWLGHLERAALECPGRRAGLLLPAHAEGVSRLAGCEVRRPRWSERCVEAPLLRLGRRDAGQAAEAALHRDDGVR